MMLTQCHGSKALGLNDPHCAQREGESAVLRGSIILCMPAIMDIFVTDFGILALERIVSSQAAAQVFD